MQSVAYVPIHRLISNRVEEGQNMLSAPALIFGGAPGLPEIIIVCVIGLLLFGKRLPDVARSLGRGVVEFKKGVQGIEDEVDRT